MRTLTCDMKNCENIETISGPNIVPDGWSQITINGYMKDPNTKYGGNKAATMRKDICTECTPKVFDFSEEPEMTLEEQFRQVATDYMEDLAINAIEQAQDNF